MNTDEVYDVLSEKMDTQYNATTKLLDNIYKQTLLTNGRVTSLEAKVNDADKESARKAAIIAEHVTETAKDVAKEMSNVAKDVAKEVTRVAKDVADHAVNCPAIAAIEQLKEENAEIRMIKKYPKAALAVLLVFLCSALFSIYLGYNKIGDDLNTIKSRQQIILNESTSPIK